jgi:hypothetical protein
MGERVEEAEVFRECRLGEIALSLDWTTSDSAEKMSVLPKFGDPMMSSCSGEHWKCPQ